MKKELFSAIIASVSCVLGGQNIAHWSFDHIDPNRQPEVFYSNEHKPSLEIIANTAVLAPVEDGGFVLDPLHRRQHDNIGAFHSPSGVITRSSLSHADLPQTGSFTLEGFVRYQGAGKRNVFFLQVDYSTPRHGFEVGIQDNGELFSRIDVIDEDGVSRFAPRAQGPVGVKASDGEWHHVAFVYDENEQTATLWIDGQSGVPAHLPAPLKRPARDLFIGKMYNPDTDLYLDEIRLSSAALAPEEFLSLSGVANPVFNEVNSLRTAPPLQLVKEAYGPGLQWGIRPLENQALNVSPPGFVWPPQRGINLWELEVLRLSPNGTELVYQIKDHEFNAHRPSLPLPAGEYLWRYRGFDKDGRNTNWSVERHFEILENSDIFTLPSCEEIAATVPQGHPRLFLTPDNLSQWRELIKGEMAEPYGVIRKRVYEWLENPPSTAEPSPYLPEEKRSTRAWHTRWWNNNIATRNAVNAVYLTGFVALMEEDDELAEFAVSLMDDLLQWDPNGSTSYAQSSEASYSYVWGLARSYTILYPWLSEQQRKLAQEKLTVRGNAMYRTHADRNHLWRPGHSHLNRTWHFLGELGLALHGEVPEAEYWLWYAMNVFANVYPVWGGEDGGWHEGLAYQRYYLSGFMAWAIIMNEALGLNAYAVSPYFKNSGYLMIYAMPPNKEGGGWGDRAEGLKGNDIANFTFMQDAARLSANGYYTDYARRISTSEAGRMPISYESLPRLFLDRYPLPEPKDINELPPSKVFPSTGQVVLNDGLADASQSVQVQFKASDFYGSTSHGYEANNSFKVWAYGERMLIKTGYRDSHGSAHHRDWMWSTRSVNNITVDGGKGQFAHSDQTVAQLLDSYLGQRFDAVVGEAGEAYFEQIGGESLLNRFTRALVFIKPATVVVIDYLESDSPRTFEYWLHSGEAFGLGAEGKITLNRNGVNMVGQIIQPQDLVFTQVNEYDPNPHEHIKLREWHLQATTAQKMKQVQFIAIYTFSPKGAESKALDYTVQAAEGGDTQLDIRLADGGIARLEIPKTAAKQEDSMLRVYVAKSMDDLEQAEPVQLKLKE